MNLHTAVDYHSMLLRLCTQSVARLDDAPVLTAAASLRDRALRLMLKSSVTRLLDTPLFTLGLTNTTDLTWRAGSGDEAVLPDNQALTNIPVENDEAAEWQPLLEESADHTTTQNWSEVGYEPRYRTIKRLSAQEELRFVVLAKAGDRFARQKLTVHYLPLLLAVARRYRHQGLSLSELVNEGTFGLVRAIERFDLARKLRFGTYAKWWMRDAIEQALANQGRLVRLPTHVMRALRGRERLNDPDGPGAAPESEEGEGETSGQRRSPFSDPDQGEIGIEETTPEVLFVEKQQQALLDRGLARLSERERQVLVCRFGLYGTESRTLMTLADELGVSHERIRQIQNNAMRKLKAFLIDHSD